MACGAGAHLMGQVIVHGLEAKQGETSAAFLVLRMATGLDRAGLAALLQRLGPMIPNVDLTALLDDHALEERMQLVGVPWRAPEAGHAVELQRRLIEAAGTSGVVEAWFFQTGTSLPDDDGDDDGDDDDDDDDADDEPALEEVEVTQRVELVAGELGDPDPDFDELDLDGLVAEDELPAPSSLADLAIDDPAWSHGLPPQVTSVPFPVDGHPAIVDELDREDVGLALKLAGAWTPGEAMVLASFHAMWLAPYGARFRNAAITIDRAHHAVHLWVDRFTAPISSAAQVGHLLWIAAKIHEVTPVLHARFGGAAMGHADGGWMGEPRAPFVLGGNPLRAVHAEGGGAAVDRWIETQTTWSNVELAAMLRELAVDLALDPDAGDELVPEVPEVAEIEVADEEAIPSEVEAPDALALPATALAPIPNEAVDESVDEAVDESRQRHLTGHAADLLVARAAAGLLDPRAAACLRPILATGARSERRRTAAVAILGAQRDRASVPALIEILDGTEVTSALDALGKDDLLVAVARALGAIADPTAVAALARIVAAQGRHRDRPRAEAGNALARCLAAAPAPHDANGGVFDALLETLAARDDGMIHAHVHLAFGRVARELAPGHRTAVANRLRDVDAHPDDTAALARQAALAIATGEPPDDSALLRARLHRALTHRACGHDATIQQLEIALAVADLVPTVVDPVDLVWLTRLAETPVRDAAHGLLERLGYPMPAAARHDRRSAGGLDDDALVRGLGELHALGHAALIDEARRRALGTASAAVIALVDAALARAPTSRAELLHADAQILEAAVGFFATSPLSADAVAVFERMLRHPNAHAKWALVHELPSDERLIPGVFDVLAEKWGWQEATAREWLAQYRGTAAFEAARVAMLDAQDEDAN
ncbi:MAG: hypothetical protein NT062_22650 [Proteobacteria bacterium]|nr:hypothetical protein [Pseudomonadota bacterium]